MTMKLENEHYHPSLAPDSDTEGMLYNGNLGETAKMKEQNNLREGQKELSPDLEFTNCVVKSDILPSHSSNEDSTSRMTNQSEDTAPSFPALEIILPETEKSFCLATSDEEIEVPVICFKEENYSGIKDICVDDGSSPDKVLLVDTHENDSIASPNFSQSYIDQSNDLDNQVKDNQRNNFIRKLEDKCSNSVEKADDNQMNYVVKKLEDNCEPCITKRGFLSDLLKSERERETTDRCSEELKEWCGGFVENTDGKISSIPQKNVVPAKFQSLYEFKLEKTDRHSSQLHGREDPHELDQDVDVRQKQALPASFLTPQSLKDENKRENTLEMGFDSSQIARTDTKEATGSDHSKQYSSTQNSTTHEGNANIPTASARSLFIQYGDDEANLIGAHSLSGLIPNSGIIPYSGSISMRSDSSTTSTRSFAFPVLQSEWHSSPVKMAKPDRRLFPRKRSWRHSLLCCRF